MATQLVGLSAASTVKTGDKLRASWVFFGASVFPAFIYDAPDTADKLREKLPSLGFAPISPRTALPGDEAIVYDVQLSPVWGTATPVSTVVDKLNRLPFPFHNLDLTRLEKISYTTSADLKTQQDQARSEANTEAKTNAVFTGAVNFLGTTGKVLALALVVAAGVGAYVLLRKK